MILFCFVYRCSLSRNRSFELAIDDGFAKGTATAFGFSIDVEARRTSLSVLDERPAPTAPVDLQTLTPEDWREDIEYLRAFLPQVHLDAFHTLAKEDWNALLDDLSGRLDDLSGDRTLVRFGTGDEIVVQTRDKPVRFLLISGAPIEEPIAWHGPIVMNTREELMTAISDLRNGTFIRPAH